VTLTLARLYSTTELYSLKVYFINKNKIKCNIIFYIHDNVDYIRGMEQKVAHRAHNPKVVGSKPASAIGTLC